jgi:NAD(P)-dependent dehydrogenase (short-subunit alcohol dehydrogenase family)
MTALQGRVVLVTGAARGIGAAVAREVAGRGGRVALVGLEADRLRSVTAALPEVAAGPHFWVEADVTDHDQLERAVSRAVEQLGRLDAVVANAGIASVGTVATTPVEALARTVEVNLTGVMRTVSATLPHVEAARGHFLLVSSAASFAPVPGLAAYSASKSGVESFGDALRLEVAHRGVTVGTAHPIWVDTDLVRDARADLPIFRRQLAKARGPLATQDVESCARLLVEGIERRQAKVFVPPSLRVLFHLRTLMATTAGRRVLTRQARRSVPELEEEVRRLGRAFGEHSAARPDGAET